MIFGFIVLCFGVLLLLHTLFPEWNMNFDLLWPCALMLISIYQMFKNKVFNVMMVILFYIGFFFFIDHLDIFTHDIHKLFFPVLVILIGMVIMIDRSINKNKPSFQVDKKGRTQYNGIFAEINEKISTKGFKGAICTSVFGGVDLDLRKSTMKEKETVIDVYAIFGGSNLIFPEGYEIIMNSYAVFGSNENKYQNAKEPKGKIYINCYSIFGGTEIK